MSAFVGPLEKSEADGSLELGSKLPCASNKSPSPSDTGDKKCESQKEAPKRLTDPSAPPQSFGEASSLTLMEYKSYFNNRPLGRCLDGFEEAQTMKISNPKIPSEPTESMEKSPQELNGGKTDPPFIRDPAEVAAF